MGLEIFPNSARPGTSCLVMTLHAPELETLHGLMKSMGGIHSFGEYLPHVTLSYNVPADIDLDHLALPDMEFQVDAVKSEPLKDTSRPDA